ncbi:hypothetical protein [Streptomyces sp. B6B3]|uniref:hypothetical protein n=1 Tax=Streptomyces sp. B6B3 TaxID=3153570 RepID=UPI00325F4F6F
MSAATLATPAEPSGPSSPAAPVPVPVSRTARRLAHLVPLLVLPSALWRVALVAGLPVAAGDLGEPPGLGERVYIVGLSLVTEGLALLTQGLVRPWGEVVPRWIPLVGGRRVPPLAAVLPAVSGAVALTAIWTFAMWRFFLDPTFIGGLGHQWLLAVCYLPLLAWGPVLLLVAVAYYRRRVG